MFLSIDNFLSKELLHMKAVLYICFRSARFIRSIQIRSVFAGRTRDFNGLTTAKT